MIVEAISTPLELGSAEATPNLQAARYYAGRGWAVLPLHTPDENGVCDCGRLVNGYEPNDPKHSIGKHPRNLHGLTDATTNEAQIKEWWGKWPTTNVAIATGAVSNIVVLDIDVGHGENGPNGEDTLAELERQYGPLPPTVEARTGGGGRHLYFLHPGGEIRKGKLAPGIEVQGEGGDVVAPPSLHRSGKRYEWINHPNQVALAPLPEWIPRLALENKAKKRQEQETGLIREGERNSFLTREAGKMRARGMDEEAIYNALVKLNEARCDPPLPDGEVRTIARSVGRYEPGQSSAPKPVISLKKPSEIMADSAESSPWILEGYIAPGELTLLSGTGKESGKSTLAFGLARAVLNGEPFLGLPTTHARVVYLTEESGQSLNEKLASFGLANADELGLVRLADVGGTPDLEAAVDAVLASEGQPGLLIVDTFATWAVLPEEAGEADTGKIKEGIVPLRKAAAKGWAVLDLHNTNADGKTRGARAIRDFHDIILLLEKEKSGNRRTLKLEGTRHLVHPDSIVFELDKQSFTYSVVGAPAEKRPDALSEDAEKVLKALKDRHPQTQNELMGSTGLRQQDVSAALLGLEKRGQVGKDREGRRNNPAHYFPIPHSTVSTVPSYTLDIPV